MPSFMILPVSQAREGLQAISTWKWFFSSMCADVNHHIVLLGSLFATIRALKKFSYELMLASNVVA
jgi:hypothetical protein